MKTKAESTVLHLEGKECLGSLAITRSSRRSKEDFAAQDGKCVLEYVDVLVDGPYIEEQRDISLHWCGSKNQRIINIRETLKQGEIITLQND